MSTIKPLKWLSGGQEAIPYTNREVNTSTFETSANLLLTMYLTSTGMTVNGNAKQKHLGCKKCGANQKQQWKQAGATKRFDIS